MTESGQSVVRYIPSVAKALEVILWIADRRKGIDIVHLVKSAFYADKYHIAQYGRPITGDVYRAAWFGPLPQVIYGLIRHEPMEMLALGNNGPLPFKVDDAYRIYPERAPNMSKLSSSDVEALEVGVKEVDGLTFDELVKKTHLDPAYTNAIAGAMDYRDFIPQDDPKRKEKIGYLEEVAPFAVL